LCKENRYRHPLHSCDFIPGKSQQINTDLTCTSSGLCKRDKHIDSSLAPRELIPFYALVKENAQIVLANAGKDEALE